MSMTIQTAMNDATDKLRDTIKIKEVSQLGRATAFVIDQTFGIENVRDLEALKSATWHSTHSVLIPIERNGKAHIHMKHLRNLIHYCDTVNIDCALITYKEILKLFFTSRKTPF